MKEINAEDAEYSFLITRAKFHERNINSDAAVPSQPQRKTNLGKFISCSSHHSAADKICSQCIVFPMQESLPNGKQVFAYYFHLNCTEGGHYNLHNRAVDVMNHWIACNVYTKNEKVVRKEIVKLFDTYNKLKVTKAMKMKQRNDGREGLLLD